MTEEEKREWFCPICNKYFDDSDPCLLWGKCPECGSTCTFLGGGDRYYLTEAMLLQLSKEYALPVVDIEGMQPLEGGRTCMSRDECLKLTAVPIKRFGEVVVIAVASPDLFRKWMRDSDFERTKGVKVRMVLAAVTDILAVVLRSQG